MPRSSGERPNSPPGRLGLDPHSVVDRAPERLLLAEVQFGNLTNPSGRMTRTLPNAVQTIDRTPFPASMYESPTNQE